MRPKPQSVNKFYFLDYFYILLKSTEHLFEREKIFESFKLLKHQYLLGESKYKKLTIDTQNLTQAQLNRYFYTFEQVIEESLAYKLITIKNEQIFLTTLGNKLIELYQDGNTFDFNIELFKLMEKEYHAMNYLINFCYKANPKRYGLLIFPIYSPLKLNFAKKDIKINNDMFRYLELLKIKLENDIIEYLEKSISLNEPNQTLKQLLIKSKLLTESKIDSFDSQNYNLILKRVRDFWLNYFLKDIYLYEYSFNSFDIWTYRGKQIGIINATEFYPNFSGKIVYPTSIIQNKMNSEDFFKLFDYSDGKSLYMHKPIWENSKAPDKFIDALTNSYFDLRKLNRSYFVNLPDLRELVCYKLKISKMIFDNSLEQTYKLNLLENLKINISLEVDKLPEETKAMYLKREPVIVDGKLKNIIAIDISKRR